MRGDSNGRGAANHRSGVSETVELSKDGNSYTGTNETKIYDQSGKMLADVTGIASAKRLSR